MPIGILSPVLVLERHSELLTVAGTDLSGQACNVAMLSRVIVETCLCFFHKFCPWMRLIELAVHWRDEHRSLLQWHDKIDWVDCALTWQAEAWKWKVERYTHYKLIFRISEGMKHLGWGLMPEEDERNGGRDEGERYSVNWLFCETVHHEDSGIPEFYTFDVVTHWQTSQRFSVEIYNLEAEVLHGHEPRLGGNYQNQVQDLSRSCS